MYGKWKIQNVQRETLKGKWHFEIKVAIKLCWWLVKAKIKDGANDWVIQINHKTKLNFELEKNSNEPKVLRFAKDSKLKRPDN